MAKADHKHPLPRYGHAKKRHDDYMQGYAAKRWGGKEPKHKSSSYVAGWLAADAESRIAKRRGRRYE